MKHGPLIRHALILVFLMASACSGAAGSTSTTVVPIAALSASAPVSEASAPPTSVQVQPSNVARDQYEPSVQLGNTTALNTARVPFAVYLNALHNRIHPIFADQFIATLDKLPASHPLNQRLVTVLEIVIDQKTGKLVKMGIVRASGVTVFDVAVMDAVNRAQPFGPAPEVISSPDANVYLHWEFHRDPIDACTTRNARPFILKSAPS